MPKRDFPLNVFTGALYSADDLLKDFDPEDPASFQKTLDFRTYRYFVKAGRNAPSDELDSMMQALHDNSITQATQAFIKGKRVVAVMGGHKMLRDSGPYADVVALSRSLSQAGFLVATGGGPGAMEASHVGAFLSKASDSEVASALAKLAKEKEVPAAADVVAADGTVNAAIAAKLHAWYKPAFEIIRNGKCGAESLAIPTWHYGHEPPTPFASHLAKYFQNSLREDGLLALATYGIIYAEGSAGTMQEIFQDAAQNYYKSFGWFSPMVLLGVEQWTKKFPVAAVLEKLFAKDDLFKQFVLVTDSVAEAVKFISAFKPPKV